MAITSNSQFSFIGPKFGIRTEVGSILCYIVCFQQSVAFLLLEDIICSSEDSGRMLLYFICNDCIKHQGSVVFPQSRVHSQLCRVTSLYVMALQDTRCIEWCNTSSPSWVHVHTTKHQVIAYLLLHCSRLAASFLVLNSFADNNCKL